MTAPGPASRCGRWAPARPRGGGGNLATAVGCAQACGRVDVNVPSGAQGARSAASIDAPRRRSRGAHHEERLAGSGPNGALRCEGAIACVQVRAAGRGPLHHRVEPPWSISNSGPGCLAAQGDDPPGVVGLVLARVLHSFAERGDSPEPHLPSSPSPVSSMPRIAARAHRAQPRLSLGGKALLRVKWYTFGVAAVSATPPTRSRCWASMRQNLHPARRPPASCRERTITPVRVSCGPCDRVEGSEPRSSPGVGHRPASAATVTGFAQNGGCPGAGRELLGRTRVGQVRDRSRIPQHVAASPKAVVAAVSQHNS